MSERKMMSERKLMAERTRDDVRGRKRLKE
jgi:hypothetical protein